MSKISVFDWDTTAANNIDLGVALNTSGSGFISTADDSFREVMAQVGREAKDLAGIGQTVGGTANAITLTINQPWAALADGQIVAFKNTVGPNTTATTITVTNNAAVSLTLKKIRGQGDTALAGGELLLNGIYQLRYVAAYDSAAGAFVLLNPSSKLNIKGTDIASATTTDIGASTGEFVDVTGTTTITGLGTVAAGTMRTVRFTGALTLTYNATSLILYSALSITTYNGLVMQFRSLGSGNWIEVSQTPATGTWTPTPFFGGANLGMTGAFTGTYTKLGKSALLNAYIAFTLKGSSSGNLALGNFPFLASAALTAQSGVVSMIANAASLIAGMTCHVNVSQNAIFLDAPISTGTTPVTNANMANNTSFSLTIAIETA